MQLDTATRCYENLPFLKESTSSGKVNKLALAREILRMKKVLFPGIQAIILMVAFFGIGQGCGLLDADSGVWIDNLEQTINFDLSVGTAQNESLQPQAQQTVTIELPANKIDLSGVDSGKIKGVRINYLNYTLTTNTSNVDLPPFDIYMDVYDATEYSLATKIAQLPSILAGQIGSGALEFVEGGREAMSGFLLDLKFTIFGRTDLTFETVDPSGQLTGTIVIGIQFKVDPI
jgi:hypothetical protein